MDPKKRLQEIAQFLKPYQRIWQNEIMLMYPDPFQDYPDDWLQELASIRRPEDVIRLERRDYAGIIHGSPLLSFYQRIDELCSLPALPEYPAFPAHKFSFLFMIPKKQHEIKKLAPFVNDFYQRHQIQKLVDIGGGIGNLAQSLTNHYNLKTTSVDMDSSLQKTGMNRHKKNYVVGHHQVEYLNVKVGPDEKEFQTILNEDSMTVGLHTCGALANYQIQSSVKRNIKGLINFGCCYDKLERDPSSQNISLAGKEAGLYLNQFALTLAARAHRKMNEKDYEFKLKVKYFRYAIHFLLYDEYEIKELANLGNSPRQLYEESFGTYALEQLHRLGLRPHHTKEELDEYFNLRSRQELIHKMLAAGLLRDALGRPLELYLLLDRVCYLREQGYHAEMLEFFDESISPRNIGIVAERV